jgi:hypothetical protein
MELSTHNKLAMLYREFYSKEDLPNNLCNYFWSLLIAVICTPLVWPALIINKFLAPFEWREGDSFGKYENPYYSRGYRSEVPIILGFLINCFLFLFGLLFTEMFYGNTLQFMSLYKIYFNGVLGIAIGILVITLFVKLITYLANRNPDSDEVRRAKMDLYYEKQKLKSIKYKQSFRYLVFQRIKAWKEQNCPLITWSNTK